MTTATASSTWHGSWKEGTGRIATTSQTLDAPFSFASRFAGAPGASPEELLAAACAGCFNQALANNFGMIEREATSIRTEITVVLGHDEEGTPAVTSILLDVAADASGLTPAELEQCVERARTRCSLAKVLKVPISARSISLSPR